MPEFRSYPSGTALPDHIRHQIRDFVRINWFDMFEVWPDIQPDWVHRPEWHPHYFVIVEGDQLLSSATACWQMIHHMGEDYKTWGLSFVMTYPAYRKRGYARRLVDAAVDLIKADPEADWAMIYTFEHLTEFYGKAGFVPNRKITFMTGPPDDPAIMYHYSMTMLLSERARRANFAQQPVYMGRYGW